MPNISDYQKAQHESFKRDVQAGGPGSGRYPAGSGGNGSMKTSSAPAIKHARAESRRLKKAGIDERQNPADRRRGSTPYNPKGNPFTAKGAAATPYNPTSNPWKK